MINCSRIVTVIMLSFMQLPFKDIKVCLDLIRLFLKNAIKVLCTATLLSSVESVVEDTDENIGVLSIEGFVKKVSS